MSYNRWRGRKFDKVFLIGKIIKEKYKRIHLLQKKGKCIHSIFTKFTKTGLNRDEKGWEKRWKESIHDLVFEATPSDAIW